jgi:nucleotide-binding universal stress UspA family protein
MDTPTDEFRIILVPLDGSELAERALLVAEPIARETGSALLLLHVIPATTWAFAVPTGLTPIERYQELLDEEDRAARDYLHHLADTRRERGLTIQTLAPRGDPASAILELQPPADLIVMTTHGRTGLARFAMGSVADRVVRSRVVPGGRAPVLLVRSLGEDRHQARLERALVPLDGSSRAEFALDMLVRLAGRVVSHALLVRVVDPQLRADEAAEAQRYLDHVRAGLAQRLTGRTCTVGTVVLHGKAADQIAERSEHKCDLVIMATHGHTGAARWAHGSVADRVLRGLRVPLLLVRPPLSY